MSKSWDPFLKIKESKKHHFHNNTSSDVNVYKGDSLKLLTYLPDNCIDMVFADPPYFGNQTGLILGRTDGHKETFDTNKANWANKKSLNSQFEFHHAWLSEVQRVLKDGSTLWVTGTYHSIGVINVVLQDLGYKLLNEIVLFKRNAPPNFTGSRFRAVSESMLWAKKNTKGKTQFNYWRMKEINGGTQMHSIWEYRAKKNPFRHPATKQPIILEKCILASSNEGDIVLDPFAGSGTTGYVSQSLKRKCILIEKELKYCNLIKKRVDGHFGNYQPECEYSE